MALHNLKNYKFLTVPNIDNTNNDDNAVILILDASGSMSSYWPNLAQKMNQIRRTLPYSRTILFGVNSKEILGDINTNLNLTGVNAGGTNIISGINLAKDIINEERAKGKQSFTIIFASDGSDSSGRSFTDHLSRVGYNFDTTGIEFICVGVGNGFPTTVSLTLRNKLHSGRGTIPSVFKIDSPRDLNNVLESTTQYFNNRTKVTMNSQCKLYPWSDYQNDIEVYCGDIVIFNCDILVMNNKLFDIVNKSMNIEYIEKIVKQWICKLHNLATINQDVKENAQIAYDVLNDIWNEFINDQNVSENRRMTVQQRLQKRLRTENYTIQILLKELKDLANGNRINELSDAEKAQRLAIGSNTGKYHNKAMQFKEFKDEDFQKYKEKFIQHIKNLKSIENIPEDEKSVISLDSLREICIQDDIISALEQCPTQWHWIQCCPLVGIAVLTEFSDGVGINPWMFRVKEVLRIHEYLDTVSLIEGGGANRTITLRDDETANAIIPLYPVDFISIPEVKNIIRSALYQLLCTYSIMGNADILDWEAHLAGLAGLYMYWLRENDSTKRTDMMNLIVENVKIIYGNKFEEYAKIMNSDESFKAFVTASPDSKLKCPCLTKVILMIACYAEKNNIENLLNLLIKEYVGRSLKGNRDIIKWFSIMENLPEVTMTYNDMGLKMTDYFHWYEVKSKIESLDICNNFDMSQYHVIFKNRPIKPNAQTGDVSLNDIKILYNMYNVNYNPNIGELLYHACKYDNSFERMEASIEPWNVIEPLIVRDKISSTMTIRRNKLVDEFRDIAKVEYYKYFNESHDHTVLPLTFNEICKIRKDRGLSVVTEDEIGYKSEIGLCNKACMIRECPFYLEIRNCMNVHWEPWMETDTFFVAFHKTIKRYRHQNVEYIFNKICNDPDTIYGNNVRSTVVKQPTNVNKEKVMVEIREIRDKYLEIYE